MIAPMNKLARPAPCQTCAGRGSQPGPPVPNRPRPWRICPTCKGSGEAPNKAVVK